MNQVEPTGRSWQVVSMTSRKSQSKLHLLVSCWFCTRLILGDPKLASQRLIIGAPNGFGRVAASANNQGAMKGYHRTSFSLTRSEQMASDKG
jgi:hypothetical protein